MSMATIVRWVCGSFIVSLVGHGNPTNGRNKKAKTKLGGWINIFARFLFGHFWCYHSLAPSFSLVSCIFSLFVCVCWSTYSRNARNEPSYLFLYFFEIYFAFVLFLFGFYLFVEQARQHFHFNSWLFALEVWPSATAHMHYWYVTLVQPKRLIMCAFRILTFGSNVLHFAGATKTTEYALKGVTHHTRCIAVN